MRLSFGALVAWLSLVVGVVALVQFGIVLGAEGRARDALQELLSNWHPRAADAVRKQAAVYAARAGLQVEAGGVTVSRVASARPSSWSKALGADVVSGVDVRIVVSHRAEVLGVELQRQVEVARTVFNFEGRTNDAPDNGSHKGAGLPLPTFVD
jgi:hypothetical protein